MELGALKSNKGRTEEYSIAPDILGRKILFVNIYMIGQPGKGNPWVLVDAGLPGSVGKIRKEAELLFGEDNPPQAIILTHGHFDHVGTLPDLLDLWDKVNVYAHHLEIPYLTGKSSYPPPDPTAGGGAMAYMSWLFPIKPIDLGDRIHFLPANGSVPFLEEWTWIHTPGHAPGHISLFRERDRALIAGDAFVTTNQNSLTSVLLQKPELHGPPAYFTINWEQSQVSIEKLLDLQPLAAGTGHGLPIFGDAISDRLNDLLDRFEEDEVPANGRYTLHPAVTDEEGVKEMPPPISYNVPRFVAMGAVFLGILGLGYLLTKNKE